MDGANLRTYDGGSKKNFKTSVKAREPKFFVMAVIFTLKGFWRRCVKKSDSGTNPGDLKKHENTWIIEVNIVPNKEKRQVMTDQEDPPSISEKSNKAIFRARENDYMSQ